jgi:hypothetical protein
MISAASSGLEALALIPIRVDQRLSAVRFFRFPGFALLLVAADLEAFPITRRSGASATKVQGPRSSEIHTF